MTVESDGPTSGLFGPLPLQGCPLLCLDVPAHCGTQCAGLPAYCGCNGLLRLGCHCKAVHCRRGGGFADSELSLRSELSGSPNSPVNGLWTSFLSSFSRAARRGAGRRSLRPAADTAARAQRRGAAMEPLGRAPQPKCSAGPTVSACTPQPRRWRRGLIVGLAYDRLTAYCVWYVSLLMAVEEPVETGWREASRRGTWGAGCVCAPGVAGPLYARRCCESCRIGR